MVSVVAELERAILKDSDPFAYLMLVAFEASGPIRFAVLLLFFPIIRLLYMLGKHDAGLRLTIFIAVVGLRISDIEYVGRAVLPKFYMDDLDMGAWRVFSQYGKRVVATRTPRVMVERFAKDHLMADHVIGSELVVNRFGFATGFVTDFGLFSDRVVKYIGADESFSMLGASSHFDTSMSKDQREPTLLSSTTRKPPPENLQSSNNPQPVIFHDGRLAMKPKPSIALVILLWFPIGLVLGIIRLVFLLITPMGIFPHENLLVGIKVNGKVPPLYESTSSNGGVLFVCNHRTLCDPVILSHFLHQKIPAVTYSMSRVSEFLSPIPTIQLTRNRQVDAAKIKKALEKGSLIICPEGTTCREPFLLRFSALFAELTDQIVPVGLIYHPWFFHSTTARGSKALDLLFHFMNPWTLYEVAFLDKLEAKDICGKNPQEVANYVQSLLANALGFTCTEYTRKDKYRILADNDGFVPLTTTKSSWWFDVRKFARHWSLGGRC